MFIDMHIEKEFKQKNYLFTTGFAVREGGVIDAFPKVLYHRSYKFKLISSMCSIHTKWCARSPFYLNDPELWSVGVVPLRWNLNKLNLSLLQKGYTGYFMKKVPQLPVCTNDR